MHWIESLVWHSLLQECYPKGHDSTCADWSLRLRQPERRPWKMPESLRPCASIWSPSWSPLTTKACLKHLRQAHTYHPQVALPQMQVHWSPSPLRGSLPRKQCICSRSKFVAMAAPTSNIEVPMSPRHCCNAGFLATSNRVHPVARR